MVGGVPLNLAGDMSHLAGDLGTPGMLDPGTYILRNFGHLFRSRLTHPQF